MAQFVAFPGVTYDDPAAMLGDAEPAGAVDVSSVLGSSLTSPFAVSRLIEEPSVAGSWFQQRRLTIDSEPALYLCRAGGHTPGGVPIQYAGVFGLLSADEGNATADATSSLIEVTRLQLDNSEFDLLLVPEGIPVVHASAGGWHYRLWALRRAGVIELIKSAVETQLDRQSHTGPQVLAFATTAALSPPPGLVFHLA